MRRARQASSFLALAALLALHAAPTGAEPGAAITLEAPDKVVGLRVLDVDGDGRADLLALEGREVRIWTGALGALPTPAPRWRVHLPADVSFVDVARENRPALIGLGAAQAQRIALADGAARVTPIEGSAGLGWRDAKQAVFAELHPGATEAGHLVPVAEGWALRTGTTSRALEVATARLTIAPGPFLEDAAVITEGLPHLLALRARGTPPSAPSALWSLAGDSLVRTDGTRRDVYDLAFLPSSGQRRLFDLDGDGVPEVLHGDGDSRELRLAFFRLASAVPGPDGVPPPPPPGDLRPPFAFLKLSGFSLEPAFVDLDEDGRLDLVVTTIDIGAPNVLRAVASGRVTAVTRAFVQRVGERGLPAFPAQPDAAVESDVGVKLRFGYAGNLDIARSFTILAGADLDGDGSKELVIRTGPDRLAVRAGTKTGVWAKEPRFVPIPALKPGEELDAQAADFDGDGRDELVLHTRAAPGGQDRLTLLSGK